MHVSPEIMEDLRVSTNGTKSYLDAFISGSRLCRTRPNSFKDMYIHSCCCAVWSSTAALAEARTGYGALCAVWVWV